MTNEASPHYVYTSSIALIRVFNTRNRSPTDPDTLICIHLFLALCELIYQQKTTVVFH